MATRAPSSACSSIENTRSKSDFCLGMQEWTEGDSTSKERPPSSKKKKLSLSLRKPEKENRWKFVEEAEQESLGERFVSKNTAVSTKWAVSNFESWRESRNSRAGDVPDSELVPANCLQSSDSNLLNKWLSVFVVETRKQDGEPYSPKSLYLLLSGILRHMRSLNPACPNFLNTEDHQFSRFHHTLDNVLRKLRSDGVGVPKQAEVFTKEDEESLWLSGILTVDNPKGLLRAVFSSMESSSACKEEKSTGPCVYHNWYGTPTLSVMNTLRMCQRTEQVVYKTCVSTTR